MKEQIVRDDFAVGGASKPNYLGSPDVVGKLVADFSGGVHDLLMRYGDEEITKEEFESSLLGLIHKNADIFMSRNPDYTPMAGWNNRYAMGMAIKIAMGKFWEDSHEYYKDDAACVLFAWLAAHVTDQAIAAHDDPDIAGVDIRHKIGQVEKLLLGTFKRA